METKKPQKRDRSNGQYAYNNLFERLCTCGHTLGNHLDGGHECIEGDFTAGVVCPCVKFKHAKK